MFGWETVVAVAATAAVLLTFMITVIVRRCLNLSKRGTKVTQAATAAPPPEQQNRGKTERRQSQPISKIETRPRSNPPVSRRGSPAKPVFDWSDHPSLITDAVENGWSRFAFTNYASSQPSRSNLLGCVGDLNHNNNQQQQQSNQRETQVEITWEVREKSLDFMQKIRMNSGMKKLSSSSSSSPLMGVKSVIRTCLPLPGPPIRSSSSFPQEAYFEITILSISSSCSKEDKIRAEGDKVKLIQNKRLEGNRNSDSIIHFGSKSGNYDLEDGDGNGTAFLIMSVGLTSSTNLPLKAPGCYPASIGFNSDGSVNLDGINLVFGSESESWGQQKVIGCGFNPTQKRVFFTLDSKLAHMVNCKSEEFSSPLYPVIAANADITVLVNMGQTSFAYEPANAARTSDPCFAGSILSSPTTKSYEGSEELFSMGRVDSGWLNHSATKSSTNSDVYSSWNNSDGKYRSKLVQDDDESEADLFEIALDVSGKSPKV